MLTLFIGMAFIEWLCLSIVTHAYIRQHVPGATAWRMVFFSTLWPLTVALWAYDYAFIADMDFI